MSAAADRAGAHVKGFGKRLAKTSRRARSAGAGLKGLVATFVTFAAVRKVVTVISDFQSTMAELSGVTGLDRMSEQFQELQQRARDLGATTRFSANEAGQALLFLARAGFTAQQSLDAVGATLNLAAAGHIQLGQAADFASNIVSSFGLRADETERVVDTLVTTSNRSNTNILQLAEAMKFGAVAASAFGNDVETTAAFIGVLGDRGIQASLAGTNLRGVFAALGEENDKLNGALEKLKLKYDDVNPVANDAVDIFKRFQDANLGATEAVTIFGRRNFAAALTFAQSADRILELRDANKAAAGEAQKMADIMQDTLQGSFLNLRSAVEETILQTGDAGLAGNLKELIDDFTAIVRILNGDRKAWQAASDDQREMAEILKWLGELISWAAGKFKDGIAVIQFALRVFKQALLEVGIAATESLGAVVNKLQEVGSIKLKGPYGPIGIDLTGLKEFRDNLIDINTDLRVEAGQNALQLEIAYNKMVEALGRPDLKRKLSRAAQELVKAGGIGAEPGAGSRAGAPPELEEIQRRREEAIRRQREAAKGLPTDRALRILEDLEFEISLTGKLTEEKEKLRAAREFDNEVKTTEADLAAALKQQFDGLYTTMQNMREAEEIAGDIGDAFGNALGRIVDDIGDAKKALVDFIKDLSRVVAQQALIKPLVGAVTSGVTGFIKDFISPTESANGNVFSRGRVTAFANGGVVSSPSFFDIGSIAEKGPEAILPLRRNSRGQLGVQADGGGRTTVNMYVTTPNADSFRKSRRQITQDVRRGIGR